jgi:hypothetical protein
MRSDEQEQGSYFFFRFCRLSVKGPRVVSPRASCARCFMTGAVLFGGKASGCPRSQSVLLCRFLVSFFTFLAMFPL